MKPGRNEPCLCGSGKKYKKCCIDKVIINDKEMEQLYLKQYSLMKNLTIQNCHQIIVDGNKIISANKPYKFISGTFTNMARAYWCLWKEINSNDDLKNARELCDKALDLKPENQQALIISYDIYIEILEFSQAAQALRSVKDMSILKKAEQQIVMSYQHAIDCANSTDFNEESQKGLSEITDYLFEKYGKNAGLCGVATSFYIGIGNDTLRAYELAKCCVEQWPNPEVYCTLGLISLYPEINRITESIDYLTKALELSKDDILTFGIKSNLVISLMQNKQYDKAYDLVNQLIKLNPNNQNYSNYAQLLKRKGNYKEAIQWCKKALFLVEDDTTLLVLADIYKKNKGFELAVETYIACLNSIQFNENTYAFLDENGSLMHSLASNSAMGSIEYEAYKGLISVYNELGDYNNAQAFLKIAKEKLPEKSEWEIWDQILPKLDDISGAYQKAKEALQNELEKNKYQRGYFRKWAADLITLQNNSLNIDLEELDNWEHYEAKMDGILANMKKNTVNETELQTKIQGEVNANYPHLDSTAKEFLVTANLLFELHQNSVIDFAPIIVEYSKVVEKQLRYLLGSLLTAEEKMLGQVIWKIKEDSIPPYCGYISDLWAVNRLRKNSAHTGLLSKADADIIRTILFTNNLLCNLR